uniref:Uncharacterized protein n=1 Tax=Thermosporothrix sp. COM3 TaxID=2490863 RepID=A0A455SM35_9CHLR|nr:hypothetical protein KTC_28100 [Thermosporothrix sp. COM3]
MPEWKAGVGRAGALDRLAAAPGWRGPKRKKRGSKDVLWIGERAKTGTKTGWLLEGEVSPEPKYSERGTRAS